MIKLKDILKEIGNFSLSADQMRNMSVGDFDAQTQSPANAKVDAMFKKLGTVLDDRTFAGWTDQDVQLFLQKFEQWVDVLRYEAQKGKTQSISQQSFSNLPKTGNFGKPGM